MHLNIIVRATDPADAAAVLGAFGIALEAPNRPNPGRWHAWGGATLSIEACEVGEVPSVALGFAHLPRRIEVTETSDRIVSRDGGSFATMEAGGISVPLRWQGEPVQRPGGDQQLLPHAEQIIEDAGIPFTDALRRTGVRNPRLVGPELLTGRFGKLFVLVVDDADDAAIATIDAVLEPHAHQMMRIKARASASFDAKMLERINHLAWDVIIAKPAS